jgi:hypothetical protein
MGFKRSESTEAFAKTEPQAQAPVDMAEMGASAPSSFASASAPAIAAKGGSFADQGNAILAGMSEEERQALGSKSHTLIFKGLLGAKKLPQYKTTAGRERTPSYKPVGIKLEFTEETQYPVIPYSKTTATDGIDPATIKYATAKAGEVVTLTLFEFMYLVSRPEYSGYVTAKNSPKGGVLGILGKKYLNGEDKLPTPSFKYTDGGSPKETMQPIDVKDEATGNWMPKPEYAEKFAKLYEVKVTQPGAGAVKFDNSFAVTAALRRDVLGIK